MLRASAMSAAAWLCLVFVVGAETQIIRRIEGDSRSLPGSAAVLVDDVPLIHTEQLLPVGDAGKIVGPGDPQAQLDLLLRRLQPRLEEFGSSISDVIRLNFYIA